MKQIYRVQTSECHVTCYVLADSEQQACDIAAANGRAGDVADLVQAIDPIATGWEKEQPFNSSFGMTVKEFQSCLNN